MYLDFYPRQNASSKFYSRNFEFRQLWSAIILTIKCAIDLEQKHRCVLEQDPGEDQMQIKDIDDCSTHDDRKHVVGQIARNRDSFNRKPETRGAAQISIPASNTTIDTWLISCMAMTT